MDKLVEVKLVYSDFLQEVKTYDEPIVEAWLTFGTTAVAFQNWIATNGEVHGQLKKITNCCGGYLRETPTLDLCSVCGLPALAECSMAFLVGLSPELKESEGDDYVQDAVALLEGEQKAAHVWFEQLLRETALDPLEAVLIASLVETLIAKPLSFTDAPVSCTLEVGTWHMMDSLLEFQERD